MWKIPSFLKRNKPTQKPVKKQFKHNAATDIYPTSNSEEFIEQLKNVKPLNFFIGGAYRIAKTKNTPQYIEVSIVFEKTILKENQVETKNYFEIVAFSRGFSGWKPTMAPMRHDINANAPVGMIDEFVGLTAADGWNCTIPATEIVSAFTKSVIESQDKNRRIGSKREQDLVKIKFFIPFQKLPPRIEVSVYDSGSKIKADLAPRLVIPFTGARRPTGGAQTTPVNPPLQSQN